MFKTRFISGAVLTLLTIGISGWLCNRRGCYAFEFGRSVRADARL